MASKDLLGLPLIAGLWASYFLGWINYNDLDFRGGGVWVYVIVTNGNFILRFLQMS